MSLRNKEIVLDYIETVWNQRKLDQLEQFVSDDYKDHSIIPAIPPNRTGLKLWIESTSKAFEHNTVVETVLQDNDDVAVRLSFQATHIGSWRGIEPSGRQATVKGFRFFKLRDGKIIAHWALLDGEALQTALTDKPHGCAIPN